VSHSNIEYIFIIKLDCWTMYLVDKFKEMTYHFFLEKNIKLMFHLFWSLRMFFWSSHKIVKLNSTFKFDMYFPTEKTYSDNSVFLITELIWVVAFYLSDREISRKLSLEERIIEIISLFRMIFCKCLNWFFKLKRLSCLFCSIMAFFFDYNRPFKRRQFL